MDGEYQAMIRPNGEVFVRRLYPDEDWRTILVAHADHEYTECQWGTTASPENSLSVERVGDSQVLIDVSEDSGARTGDLDLDLEAASAWQDVPMA